jgi:peptidoglycan hydrolase CwlO-like protein
MKLRTYVTLLALMMTVTATTIHAATIDDKNPKREKTAAMTEEQKAARLEEIRERVNEIKAMDKSALSKADRKALKKELKGMNKEARSSRGVYLSVGAIIIIILLLILIL